MNSNFITCLRKPPIYPKSKVEFWNDEYISEQMLKAHLDPEFDGASRKFYFIEKSVEWITEQIPLLLPPHPLPSFSLFPFFFFFFFFFSFHTHTHTHTHTHIYR